MDEHPREILYDGRRTSWEDYIDRLAAKAHEQREAYYRWLGQPHIDREIPDID